MHKNNLLDSSLEFSILSMDLYKSLTATNEYVLSKQFFRSATSIGANICESKFAESRKDFIHKLSIALKECNETLYWLTLIDAYNNYSDKTIALYKTHCNILKRLLAASINTARKKL